MQRQVKTEILAQYAGKKPRLAVGVSVLITKNRRLLLGKRKNNTAAGLYSTPGGRIELLEDMFECAVRETIEETGLTIYKKYCKVISVQEHFRYGDHYIMFYMHVDRFTGELENKEPDKCEGWDFIPVHLIQPRKCTEPRNVLNLLENRL